MSENLFLEYDANGEPIPEWREQECAAHNYKGVPPCPVPDCENGTNNPSRELWVTIKVKGLDEYDSCVVSEERIFYRATRYPRPHEREYFWRELIDKPAAA